MRVVCWDVVRGWGVAVGETCRVGLRQFEVAGDKPGRNSEKTARREGDVRITGGWQWPWCLRIRVCLVILGVPRAVYLRVVVSCDGAGDHGSGDGLQRCIVRLSAESVDDARADSKFDGSGLKK